MKTLIVGGSSDIGLAIARRRLAAGDDVVVTATTEDNVARAVESLRVEGRQRPQGLAFRFERAAESAEALAPHLASGVDALVVNAFAPVAEVRPFLASTPSEIVEYVAPHVGGVAWLLAAALPGMQARGFGRVVFVSSLSAAIGAPGYAAYCAAKAAIESLVKVVANELGADGIRANIVRPGFIMTSRTKEHWEKPVYRQRVGRAIPAGDLGTPEAVAEAIDYFLGRACYANGATLDVTGGLPALTVRGMLSR